MVYIPQFLCFYIVFIKWKQNNIAPDTYINNDYTNVMKSKKMASNSKQKQQTKSKKNHRDEKLVFQKK